MYGEKKFRINSRKFPVDDNDDDADGMEKKSFECFRIPLNGL